MSWTIFTIYLFQGLLLGLQAGLSPGPFTTVIISESLSHGRKVGMKCSLVPLFSDPPIIFLSLLLLDRISGSDTILGSISLLGAVLLAWIAYQCFRVRAEQFENPTKSAAPFTKLIVVNLLNPNIYIYWMTILSPICIKAARDHGVGYTVWFIASFYAAIITCKMTMAFIAGGARHRLDSRWLVLTNNLLGVAMLLFVALFAYSGLKQIIGW